MKWILSAVLCLVYSPSFSQTFKGQTPKEEYGCNHCELHIGKDSSAILVCHNKGNIQYLEYKGTIRKVNDTLLRLTATRSFSKADFKGNNNSTIVIADCTDSGLKSADITYKDGFRKHYDLSAILKKMEFPDTRQKSYYSGEIKLDPLHFIYKDTMDKAEGMIVRSYTSPVNLEIGHRHPITGKPVIFSTWDCGSDFRSGKSGSIIEFTIKGQQLKVNGSYTQLKIPPMILSKSK